MTPDFHLKLHRLSQELSECAKSGTKEHHLDVINRAISHIESEFGPCLVILEALKDLREQLLPTLEDIQAIYSRDTKQD